MEVVLVVVVVVVEEDLEVVLDSGTSSDDWNTARLSVLQNSGV